MDLESKSNAVPSGEPEVDLARRALLKKAVWIVPSVIVLPLAAKKGFAAGFGASPGGTELCMTSDGGDFTDSCSDDD